MVNVTGRSVVLAAVVSMAACDGNASGPEGPEPLPSPDLPILFASDFGALVATDAAGSRADTLLPDSHEVFRAEWSPLGSEIAVVAGGRGARKLYLLTRESGALSPLSDVEADVARHLDWSADGRYLVFTTEALDVYVSDLQTGTQTPLTPDPLYGMRPDISRDGQWVVYHGGDRASPGGIYRVRPDGTGRELLIEQSSGTDHAPQFSPDGSTIVVERGNDLYLMDADGGNVRQITHTPAEGDWGARYSPDGRKLAFQVDAGEYWGVGILDLARGEITDTLGDRRFGNLGPRWSPDGGSVAFDTYGSVIVQQVGEPDFTSVGLGRFPSWYPGID